MLRRLRRLLGWPWRELWLLAKAWALLVAIRISLATLRYERTHRFLRGRHAQPARRHIKAMIPLPRIARILELASCAVPGGGHCLTRAVAAEYLMRRRGYDAEVCIGVAKDEAGKLIAHAWVEFEGEVVLGDDPELSQYTRMRPS